MEEKNIKNIHQRLLAVMSDISYVLKSDKKVNNQYSFASHDAVTALCRRALIEHGVRFKSSVDGHEKEWVTMTSRGGDTQYLFTHVKIKAEFINVDDPKDNDISYFYGTGLDTQDKGEGKAVSYACKYALLKNLMLETGDDPEKDVSMNFKSGVFGSRQIFKTAKLFKDAHAKVLADLDQSSNFNDVKDAWLGNKDVIKKIKDYSEAIGQEDCYTQLVERKDYLKQGFSQLERQLVEIEPTNFEGDNKGVQQDD